MYTLTYEGLTVELPNPDFGDKLQLDTGAIVRKSRGGDVLAAKPSAWPQVEVERYKFSGMTRSEAAAVRHLLIESQGDVVTLNGTDGVIITEIAEIIVERDDTFYDLAFDLQVLQ